jgi:hypothetical protein
MPSSTHPETEPEREVIEPEVLAPDESASAGGASAADSVASVRWTRTGRALVAGLLLDAADLASPIPHLAVYGLFAGFYVVWTQQIPRRQWPAWIAACVLYCAIPRTGFMPLATLYFLYRALRTK